MPTPCILIMVLEQMLHAVPAAIAARKIPSSPTPHFLAADEDEEDPVGAAAGGGGLPPIAVVGASASDDADYQEKDALPRGKRGSKRKQKRRCEESGGALSGTRG
jgi:hypothetical protein